MTGYFSVMFSVVLPIALTCFAGILIQRFRPIDVRTLVDVSLYVLAPSLVLISLDQSKNNAAGILQIVLFTLLDTVACWGIAVVVGRMARLQPAAQGTLSLTTIFGNANNYGLPVLLLAYGTRGFSLGINYVVLQIILVNSLGLYIASRSSVSARQAMTKIAQTPLLYAVIVGVLCLLFHIHFPTGVVNGLRLMGNGYAAVVLLILGIQLRKTNLRHIGRWHVWLAVGMRVLVVPILSLLCLFVLGIHGLLASVLFVQSSMPAAVNTAVLVEKYGGDQQLVTLTVAVTTIISFATLPMFIHMGVR